VNDDGSVGFAGVHFLAEELLAPPSARTLGITYTVPEERDQGAISRFLAFDDMKVRHRDWERIFGCAHACMLALACGRSTPGGPSSASVATDGDRDANLGGGADVQITKDVQTNVTSDLDAGWSPVPWVTNCDVQQAGAPERAVPSLEWQSCGAGCSQLTVNWPNDGENALNTPQIYRSESSLRIGMHLIYPSWEWRKAIYDENMHPIAAWRGPNNRCGGLELQWTARGVCMVLGTPNQTFDAILSLSDVMGPPTKVFNTPVPHGTASCSDSLLSYQNVISGAAFVRVLDSREELPFQPPAREAFGPLVVGEYALMTGWGGAAGDVLDGWVWTRANGTAMLVDPGKTLMFDMRADSSTLVWIQAVANSIYEPATSTEIWSSPFSASATQLTPKKLRDGPSTTVDPDSHRLGGGYYAVLEGVPNDFKPKRVHIYRLSDGHHWVVPPRSGVVFGAVAYVDSEEVWIVGVQGDKNFVRTLVRQKLIELGPGD